MQIQIIFFIINQTMSLNNSRYNIFKNFVDFYCGSIPKKPRNIREFTEIEGPYIRFAIFLSNLLYGRLKSIIVRRVRAGLFIPFSAGDFRRFLGKATSTSLLLGCAYCSSPPSQIMQLPPCYQSYDDDDMMRYCMQMNIEFQISHILNSYLLPACEGSTRLTQLELRYLRTLLLFSLRAFERYASETISQLEDGSCGDNPPSDVTMCCGAPVSQEILQSYDLCIKLRPLIRGLISDLISHRTE
jgi:hypothetical protein